MRRVTHRLVSRRSLPGGRRTRDGWEVAWSSTRVMGIINVTPDSFSDGGRFGSANDAVAHGLELWRAGAWILDIGGESTRPGSAPVSEEHELERVVPVIAALAESTDAILSIDTSKAGVARAAVVAGAHLVNDVTGLRRVAMRDAIADLGVPAIAMHMQGEPRTMQDEPNYDDVVGEVEAFLVQQAAVAVEAGIPSVVLDPGIGFGKTVEHNIAVTRAIARLAGHGRPLMIGASRKRSIGSITGEERPDRRDAGSVAWHLYAARAGAALVRVHDVAAHVQALAVWRALDG